MTLADTTLLTTPQHRSGAGAETALVVRILTTLAVLLLAWGFAVATWGLPALYLPALALVPVIFAGMMVFLWG